MKLRTAAFFLLVVQVPDSFGQQAIELGVIRLQLEQPPGVCASMPPKLARHL